MAFPPRNHLLKKQVGSIEDRQTHPAHELTSSTRSAGNACSNAGRLGKAITVPTISHLVGIPTDTPADARLQPRRTRCRAIAAGHMRSSGNDV